MSHPPPPCQGAAYLHADSRARHAYCSPGRAIAGATKTVQILSEAVAGICQLWQDVVRADDEGGALAAVSEDELPDGVCGDGVESLGGVVEDEYLGVDHECPCKGDASFHAAGEFDGEQVCGMAYVECVEDMRDAAVGFVFGQGGELFEVRQRESEVVHDAEVFE